MTTVTQARARVASRTRLHGAGAPGTLDAKRALHEAKLAAHIERTLAAAPPLTDEQRARLAAMLRPTATR